MQKKPKTLFENSPTAKKFFSKAAQHGFEGTSLGAALFALKMPKGQAQEIILKSLLETGQNPARAGKIALVETKRNYEKEPVEKIVEEKPAEKWVEPTKKLQKEVEAKEEKVDAKKEEKEGTKEKPEPPRAKKKHNDLTDAQLTELKESLANLNESNAKTFLAPELRKPGEIVETDFEVSPKKEIAKKPMQKIQLFQNKELNLIFEKHSKKIIAGIAVLLLFLIIWQVAVHFSPTQQEIIFAQANTECAKAAADSFCSKKTVNIQSQQFQCLWVEVEKKCTVWWKD